MSADTFLASLPSGAEATISRISDRDPARLRAVEALGLTPGRHIGLVANRAQELPDAVALRRHLPGHIGLHQDAQAVAGSDILQSARGRSAAASGRLTQAG